jgi:hypothetical protein
MCWYFTRADDGTLDPDGEIESGDNLTVPKYSTEARFALGIGVKKDDASGAFTGHRLAIFDYQLALKAAITAARDSSKSGRFYSETREEGLFEGDSLTVLNGVSSGKELLLEQQGIKNIGMLKRATDSKLNKAAKVKGLSFETLKKCREGSNCWCCER